MLIKMHAGIIVGDFIKAHGHNVNEGPWRKVIEIDGDTLVTVNRHGRHQSFTWAQGRKWKTWQPGDPRQD